MKTFTLEWNAVTTLEDPTRFGYGSLRDLIELHGKTIDLGIATTAASENTREKKFPESADEFMSRLEAVGLSDLTMVLTSGCFELTYFDLCCIVGDSYGQTVNKLWKIIEPRSLPQNEKDFAIKKNIAETCRIIDPEYQKWRNKWCDVHSIEAHISAGRDVFVTGDIKNVNAREKLASLGVGHICSYDEALEIALQESSN